MGFIHHDHRDGDTKTTISLDSAGSVFSSSLRRWHIAAEAIVKNNEEI